jgi:hypothetical protein
MSAAPGQRRCERSRPNEAFLSMVWTADGRDQDRLAVVRIDPATRGAEARVRESKKSNSSSMCTERARHGAAAPLTAPSRGGDLVTRPLGDARAWDTPAREHCGRAATFVEPFNEPYATLRHGLRAVHS